MAENRTSPAASDGAGLEMVCGTDTSVPRGSDASRPRPTGPACGCEAAGRHEDGCDVGTRVPASDNCWRCAAAGMERLRFLALEPDHYCEAGRVRLELLAVAG